MRESRTYGSVRGAYDETHVPTATVVDGPPPATNCHRVMSDRESQRMREPSNSKLPRSGLISLKMCSRFTGSTQREGRCSEATAAQSGDGIFRGLPPCLVGMEACATAHHWARN